MDPVIHLLHACKDGDLGTVKDIIERERVDVNVTFYFLFDGNVYNELLDATPLLLAASGGHLKVCQYLVGKGANVNYLTTVQPREWGGKSIRLSPLHAAIKGRRLIPKNKALIEYLMANGADLSVLPILHGISLPFWKLVSSDEVDVPLTKFLIDLGLISPSLPWCQVEGCTVLHQFAFANHQGSVLIFKNLLEKGADINVLDKYGLTPLNVAAIGGYPGLSPLGNPNEHVLRYLLHERDDIISLSEKIEALELAGSSILLFNEDQDSIDRAFQLWNEAQDLRDNAEEPIIPKTSLNADQTVPWRSVEWATRDELDQLRLRPLAEIKMQAFLVTRRFLVRISSSALVCYLWSEFVTKHFSLSTLYRETRFNELLDICWLMVEGTSDCQELGHEKDWKMVVKCNYWIVKTLIELKKTNDPILNLEMLKFSMKLVFDSSNRSPRLSPTVTVNQRVTATVLTNVFNLIHNLLSSSPEMITPEVNSLLLQFILRDVRDSNGYNLLLVACRHFSVLGGSLTTLRLILDVGADPNSKDRNGFSPLHIIVAHLMKKGEMYSPLADLLLEFGAHLDRVDDFQRTPLDIWKELNDGEAGEVLSPPAWLNPVLSLKCYCARAIKRSNTPCEEEQLPIKSLRDFVAEH